jgi:cytochrome c oxidase accessory protein FixG
MNTETAEVKPIWLYVKTRKVYPRAIGGIFAKLRWAMVILTQLVFYGLPWLSMHGRQAVLFDLETRRFYVFGLVLYPQDFVFLSVLLILCALSLFAVTAVAGRVWCGYACPQTVYSKLFLWIEHVVEGDRQRRIKLDAAPWSASKLGRKTIKQGLWIALALWTGLSFVGYFIPIRELVPQFVQGTVEGWALFWVVFYGLATYGNAGFMREQVCKYMCPYARFQSAMFDQHSLIVSYDEKRGEPRGSRSRGADPKSLGLGDCVDCTLCVQVCPTGIDIRKGLQYECIGCAACVDACDSVMDKLGYPRGLVRYTTQTALAQRWPWDKVFEHLYRPRVIVYGVLLSVIGTGLVAGLIMRPPIRADVIRDRGVLARELNDGVIENVYRVQLMNTTEKAQRVIIAARSSAPMAISSQPVVDIPATRSVWVPVSLQVQAGALPKGSNPVELVFRSQDAELVEPTKFLVPR